MWMKWRDSTIASASRLASVRRTLLIAVLIIMVGEWGLIVALATQLNPPHISDFGMYYAAAMLLRHNPHGDIYSASALLEATKSYGGCPQLIPPQYVYPPLLAIALEPITLLPCAHALVVWTLFNALLWALSAAIMVDLLRRYWADNRLGVWALVITGSVAFWPAYRGLFLGQTHLLLLFLMLVGIWLERNERPWLAGAALVCAALVKPLPALLLLYYLVRGKWTVMGGALITGAALLALMLVGSGAATVAGSVSAALHSADVQAHPGQDEALSIVAEPYGVALVILAFGVYMVVLALRRNGDNALGAAWTLCSMLLFSPVVWAFYFIWLLPVLVICLGNGRSLMRFSSAYYASLALIYVALAAPFWPFLQPFALLALWALCGAMYWRSSTPALRFTPAVAS